MARSRRDRLADALCDVLFVNSLGCPDELRVAVIDMHAYLQGEAVSQSATVSGWFAFGRREVSHLECKSVTGTPYPTVQKISILCKISCANDTPSRIN